MNLNVAWVLHQPCLGFRKFVEPSLTFINSINNSSIDKLLDSRKRKGITSISAVSSLKIKSFEIVTTVLVGPQYDCLLLVITVYELCKGVINAGNRQYFLDAVLSRTVRKFIQ